MKCKAFIISFISLIFIFMLTPLAYADSDYLQNVNALSSIGVFEENAVNIDGSTLITRGELLKAVVNIFANIECEAKQVYKDIHPGNEYFESAYLAYQLGIDLSENGNFNAQDYMSVEEFSKLVLTASGYEFLTEKYTSSEYPYTLSAMYLEILDKKYYGNEKMSFNDAADALYNLLFVGMPISAYGENKISYSVSSDISVLEHCLGLKHAEGIVVSNEYTNINPGKSLKSNNIELSIDGGKNLILTDAKAYCNLLGYSCEVFYRENGNSNAIVYAFKSDNDEILIDGDDLYNFDRKSMKFEYKVTEVKDRFEEEFSVRKEQIPFDAQIIYNGQYASNSEAVFDILCNPGELNIDYVSLVDNDGNGKTDVIIANVYKNFGVKSVNKHNQSFTSTRNDVIVVDENEKFYDITIDGKKSDWSKLSANMMLAVKEGFGEKALVTIEAINTSFLGSFYRLEKDSIGNAYAEISVGEATDRGAENIGSYVGGSDNQLHIERYELDNSLYAHSGEILTGNHMYRIFLDKKGKIGALGVHNYGTYASWFMTDFSLSTYSTIEFGIGVSVKKESVLRNTLELEVATIKKVLRTVTLETYRTSKDLKIENIPEGIISKYGSDWKKYSSEALYELFINNLFEIAFDSDGNIKRIIFPCEEKTEGKLSYFNAPGQSYIYKAGILRSLTSDDFIYEYSKLMCIQVPKAGTDPGIDSLYRIIYFNANTFVESGIYKINTYTFSKSSYMPEIMVMVTDYDGVEVMDRMDNINLGIVEMAYRVSTDNGDADAQFVHGMSGVSSLEKAAMLTSVYGETYVTPPASKANDGASYGELNTHYKAPVSKLEAYDDPISSGDIVLYSMPHYNTAGSALRYYNSALKLYDYDTKTIVQDQSGTVNGSTNIVIGKIKNVDERFFSLSVDGKDGSEELIDIRYDNGSSQRTYVYTPLRDGGAEIRCGTMIDIKEAKANNWDVAVAARKLIVIYKD